MASLIIMTVLLALFGICIFKINQFPHVIITAHRGFSAQYPENTCAAFQSAMDNGADCIELDIRQTADGVLVVMHDSSLLRTTGLNKEVGDVTYEEIKRLDGGSWYSRRFAGEEIPTFEKVLKLVQNQEIKLNVELKSSRPDMEQHVVDLIRQYGLQKRCIIASQNYEILKKIKRYAPNITTAYLTSETDRKVVGMRYADGFSVPACSVTKAAVSRIHAAGKKIHVWTVNTKDEIIEMIDLGVDDVITDNPSLVIEEVSSIRGNMIQTFSSLLLPD